MPADQMGRPFRARPAEQKAKGRHRAVGHVGEFRVWRRIEVANLGFQTNPQIGQLPGPTEGKVRDESGRCKFAVKDVGSACCAEIGLGSAAKLAGQQAEQK